jgi:hypothetical protein
MAEHFYHPKQGKVFAMQSNEMCREGQKNFTKQKSPGKTGAFFSSRDLSDSSYVRGLKPFRTLGYFKRYSIAFSKGLEPVARNCGEMTKNIFAIFLLQKTKTLAVIKPFYRSIYHVLTFS